MGVEFPPNAVDDSRSKVIVVVGEDGRLKLPKDAYRGNSRDMVDEILGNFTTKAVVSYIATHPQDVRERLSRWRQAVSEDRRALAGLEDVDDYLNGRRQNADCWVVRVVAIEPEPPLHFD